MNTDTCVWDAFGSFWCNKNFKKATKRMTTASRPDPDAVTRGVDSTYEYFTEKKKNDVDDGLHTIPQKYHKRASAKPIVSPYTPGLFEEGFCNCNGVN